MTSDTPTGGNRLPIMHRAFTGCTAKSAYFRAYRVFTGCTAKSAYFQSLDAVARVRYQEKLALLGFSVSEDPYEL